MAHLEDSGPTSHTFVSQRLRLQYVDWGNAEAPTLILQHGGRDHARSWDWVARALRRDFHIIAPDLRGHGDSAWSPDAAYSMSYYISDMAQLIDQLAEPRVAIIAHSLGAAISLCYAGLFPEKVSRLIAIEGVGGVPTAFVERFKAPFTERWREWIGERRQLSGRSPRRYASIEEALQRMRAENRHLSAEQARHLTIHGVIRNEDGTYSWKFDNYVRTPPPQDFTDEQQRALWGRIACPTLLAFGHDSWAPDPAADGSAAQFHNARVVGFENAGHWLHHDRLDAFLAEARAFLA